MTTDRAPSTCPHCGAPTTVNKIPVHNDAGYIKTIDGRWDCTAECYLTDPDGFATSLRRHGLKAVDDDTAPDVTPTCFVLCRGAYEDSTPLSVHDTLDAAQRAATWITGGWELETNEPGARDRWRSADPEIPFTDWATIWKVDASTPTTTDETT